MEKAWNTDSPYLKSNNSIGNNDSQNTNREQGRNCLKNSPSCRELGIQTLAVYSEADEQSLHVQLADEAICIGPAQSTESYLKADRILSAAELANVDAIHRVTDSCRKMQILPSNVSPATSPLLVRNYSPDGTQSESKGTRKLAFQLSQEVMVLLRMKIATKPHKK